MYTIHTNTTRFKLKCTPVLKIKKLKILFLSQAKHKHASQVLSFYSKHIHNAYPCFTPSTFTTCTLVLLKSKSVASQTISNFRPSINCAPFMLWSVCILNSSPESFFFFKLFILRMGAAVLILIIASLVCLSL